MNRRHFTLQTAAALMVGALAACDQTPAQAATPSVAKIPADQAYALAAKGTGFSVGPLMAAHTAYVFFDTTCPHCAHLWQALQPLANQVRVVWMPVGYLQPKSLTQGVTILSAAEPKVAMAENEQRLLARQGGIVPASPLNEDLVQKVKANTALFMQISGESVPLILFRNAKTGEYGSQAGAMDTAQFAALLGL
ncbi:thioredoxin fold domain-containing protein [Ideonella dechloratans]|uniref:thioredoxin fold domain-containing protein n=1 Tax=Ideonella dechloratans TaxID=36863 RepID=UPI0035B45FD5